MADKKAKGAKKETVKVVKHDAQFNNTKDFEKFLKKILPKEIVKDILAEVREKDKNSEYPICDNCGQRHPTKESDEYDSVGKVSVSMNSEEAKKTIPVKVAQEIIKKLEEGNNSLLETIAYDMEQRAKSDLRHAEIIREWISNETIFTVNNHNEIILKRKVSKSNSEAGANA